MTPPPPPPPLLYIYVHRTACTSVSHTMLYQRPQDHLHVCILYNALTTPHNHHYYTSTSTGPSPCLYLVQCSHNAPQPPLLYVNVHWTISMSVSCTMLSQRPTTTTTIRQRPLDHLCLIQSSHKALQPPLLYIRQCPLEHLHIRVSYNVLTKLHNGSHGP